MTLDDTARQLVDGRNFATIATINPDGSPQTSVVWVGLDGDIVRLPGIFMCGSRPSDSARVGVECG